MGRNWENNVENTGKYEKTREKTLENGKNTGKKWEKNGKTMGENRRKWKIGKMLENTGKMGINRKYMGKYGKKGINGENKDGSKMIFYI